MQLKTQTQRLRDLISDGDFDAIVASIEKICADNPDMAHSRSRLHKEATYAPEEEFWEGNTDLPDRADRFADEFMSLADASLVSSANLKSDYKFLLLNLPDSAFSP